MIFSLVSNKLRDFKDAFKSLWWSLFHLQSKSFIKGQDCRDIIKNINDLNNSVCEVIDQLRCNLADSISNWFDFHNGDVSISELGEYRHYLKELGKCTAQASIKSDWCNVNSKSTCVTLTYQQLYDNFQRGYDSLKM